MKYYLVADFRESFENVLNTEKIYNDHCSKKAVYFMIEEIKKCGYDIEYFGGVQELVSCVKNNQSFKDEIFINISNGLQQKNRKAQSSVLLEMVGAKFSGSTANTIMLVGNKYFTNQILCGANISRLNIPKSILYRKGTNLKIDKLSFPVIVKPNDEGSSLGINQASICSNIDEVKSLINQLEYSFPEIIIEQYIPGHEITNLIIGNKDKFELNECLISSYSGEKYFEHFVFGAIEKSDGKRMQSLVKDEINYEIITVLKQISEKIFCYLGMRDVARFDYRIENNQIYFIEVNANPVISETSELGTICRQLEKPYSYVFNKYIKTITSRINHD